MTWTNDCRICGHQYEPKEPYDYTEPCPRCADMTSRLTPPVVEWIKDLVSHAFQQHLDDYEHERRRDY